MPANRSSSRPVCSRSTGLLTLTLLGLSSCANTGSAPTPAARPAIPLQWQQSAATGALDLAALSQWWHRFDDPVLDQLITRALETGPTIRTALARIDESRARHAVQRAGFLPSLTASVSSQGSRNTNRQTDT
ncbi:MAG: TolC family protein, partial [Verrucomicrobia bacterium]|nr:TolC family protein [Verrucomicrobiota bacterium]